MTTCGGLANTQPPVTVFAEKLSESTETLSTENMSSEMQSFELTRKMDVEHTAANAQAQSRAVNSRPAGNEVNWDGPDDPALPTNWRPRKKWTNLLLISTLTLLTLVFLSKHTTTLSADTQFRPFASSMFAPSIEDIMREMGTTDRNIGSFAVSVYLLGYAFGPLLIAPCSELYGRLPVYFLTMILFILGNIACALSYQIPMLIAFRFITGCFGAGPLTIGPGSVADCFKQVERGRAMAVWTMPVLLGPCLGPAVGAYLSRALGWRWMFYILCIVVRCPNPRIDIMRLTLQQTAVVLAVCGLMLQETHAPTILRQRTERLRKATQNMALQSVLDSDKTHWQLFAQSIIRPTKMLCFSPIILGLSLLTAVAYGTLYLLFTTVNEVFITRYGIITNVGLVYLGFGAGQFAGLFVFGIVSDAILKRLARGGETKPEYRLPPMLPGGAMIPIGLLIYGWTAQYHVHWIVPLIGTFLIGFGMITVFTPVGTYLVDAFPEYAASATAANTVFRSIGGGLLPMAGPSMYQALDQGWGNSLLAGVSLGMMGMIVLVMKYGETLRTHPKYQLRL